MIIGWFNGLIGFTGRYSQASKRWGRYIRRPTTLHNPPGQCARRRETFSGSSLVHQHIRWIDWLAGWLLWPVGVAVGRLFNTITIINQSPSHIIQWHLPRLVRRRRVNWMGAAMHAAGGLAHFTGFIPARYNFFLWILNFEFSDCTVLSTFSSMCSLVGLHSGPCNIDRGLPRKSHLIIIIDLLATWLQCIISGQ